jgi:hypothetical protein
MAPCSMLATGEHVYMPPGHTLSVARPNIVRLQAACASFREIFEKLAM